MDENEYALRMAEVKAKIVAVERELSDLLDADPELTDDQSEHVEDIMSRINDATAIMA